MLFGVAGHRHQGWCRRHGHSGPRHLSPVPEHSGIGLGSPYTGTRLVLESAFSFISGTGLTGSRTVRHSGIFKIVRKKGDTLRCWRWRVIHPARSYMAADSVELSLWCWQIISKCQNVGMPRTGSRLRQYGIGHSSIEVSPVALVTE
jgi:hypothetical protein